MPFRLLVVAVCVLAVVQAALAAGRWSRVAPLPHPRSAHAVVATGGSIYVLGGPGTAAVDRFDGTRWTRAATLPPG